MNVCHKWFQDKSNTQYLLHQYWEFSWKATYEYDIFSTNSECKFIYKNLHQFEDR